MSKITRTMKLLKITEGGVSRYVEYVPGVEEFVKELNSSVEITILNAIVEMTTAEFVKYGTVKETCR